MQNLNELNETELKGQNQTLLINEALKSKGYSELQLLRYSSKNGNRFYGQRLTEKSKYPTDTPAGVVYQEYSFVLTLKPQSTMNKILFAMESNCPIMQSEFLKHARFVEASLNKLNSVTALDSEVEWKVDLKSGYGQTNRPFMVLNTKNDDVSQLIDTATDIFIEAVSILKLKNVGDNTDISYDSLEKFEYKY